MPRCMTRCAPCGCCAAQLMQDGCAPSRVGVIGFSAGGHLVRAPDHRAGHSPMRGATRRTTCPRAPGFRGADVSGHRDHRPARACRLSAAAAAAAGVQALPRTCARYSPHLNVGAPDAAHAAGARRRRHQRAGGEFAADVRRACARRACAANCIVFDAAAMASDCAASPARTWRRGRRWFRTGRCTMPTALSRRSTPPRVC